MSQQNLDIYNIRRPKLIMSAAKELVMRRKQRGVATSRKNIQQICAQEYECEELRKSRSVNYAADSHIRLLADIIEFIRDEEKVLNIA